jgi:hypothetical protein
MNPKPVRMDAWFVKGFVDQITPKTMVEGTKVAIYGWDLIKTALVEYAYAIATSLVCEDAIVDHSKEFYQGKYIDQFKTLYNMLLTMWRLRMIPDETTIEVDPRVQTNLAKPKEKRKWNR